MSQVIKSFKFDDDGVSHAAVDLIATLMQPMHDNYNLRQEQLNKASLISTKAFLEKLVSLSSNGEAYFIHFICESVACHYTVF